MIKKTKINNGLELCEYTDGLLFGTDALLLSRFVKGGAGKIAVDIGTGSGVISLLLLSENKAKHITGIEIQKDYALLATDNAKLNGLQDRFSCICGDARIPNDLFENEKADYVVSNPPFMKSNGGKFNNNDSKTIARHEEFLPVDALCKAASRYLKFGGVFYVVYRPERIATLIASLKNSKLEPKRIEFVCGTNNGVPSLVLVEAKKGAAEGAKISFKSIN